MKVLSFTNFINERNSTFNLETWIVDNYFLIDNIIYIIDLKIEADCEGYPAEPDVGIQSAGYELIDFTIIDFENLYQIADSELIEEISTLLINPNTLVSIGITANHIYGYIMDRINEYEPTEITDETLKDRVFNKIKELDLNPTILEKVDLTNTFYNRIETAIYEMDFPERDDDY